VTLAGIAASSWRRCRRRGSCTRGPLCLCVCMCVCVCVRGWGRARSGKQVDAFTGLQGKAQQLLAGRRCYLLHEDSVYCIKSSVAAASTRQSLSIRQGSSSSLRGSYSRPPKYCSDPGPGLSVTLPPLSAPSCIWLCHHTSSLLPRVPNSLLPAPPPLAPLLPVGNLPHRLPPPPPSPTTSVIACEY